jgi:hypothetical protein
MLNSGIMMVLKLALYAANILSLTPPTLYKNIKIINMKNYLKHLNKHNMSYR